MNWAVAALIAYMALSERMAKLEAGAGLAAHRIAAIERQVEELTRDSKRTLENTATTKTMVESIRDEMRRR
jgi:hypothetical protein